MARARTLLRRARATTALLGALALASVADAGTRGDKMFKVPDLAVPAAQDVKEAAVIPVAMKLPKGASSSNGAILSALR